MLGNREKKRGEITELIITLDRALQRIGNAYSKLNDLDNAIKYYGKSLTEHRTPETLQKLRDTEKLKKEQEKAAYYNPELADKAREEGNTFFKEGKW